MAEAKSVLRVTVRILTIFALLYIFICSLDLLSISFRLVSGKGAGEFHAPAHRGRLRRR